MPLLIRVCVCVFARSSAPEDARARRSARRTSRRRACGAPQRVRALEDQAAQRRLRIEEEREVAGERRARQRSACRGRGGARLPDPHLCSAPGGRGAGRGSPPPSHVTPIKGALEEARKAEGKAMSPTSPCNIMMSCSSLPVSPSTCETSRPPPPQISNKSPQTCLSAVAEFWSSGPSGIALKVRSAQIPK